MKCWEKSQEEKKKDFWFLSIKTRVKQQLRGPVWINTINKSPLSDPPTPPRSCGFSFFKTLASPSGSNFKRDVKPATTSCETCALSRKVEDPPPPPPLPGGRAKITCARGDPVDLGFFAGRRKAPGLPDWGCQSGGGNITALSCWRAGPLRSKQTGKIAISFPSSGPSSV